MFDWFFKLFKKKEKETPININLSVYDLRKGCILDYDMESWEVLGSFTYQHKGYVSKEYKIRSSSQTLFLNVTDSNSLKLSLSSEANINNIDANLRSSIVKGDPLAKINWEGEKYTLKEESRGKFAEDEQMEWDSFRGWEYSNADNTKFVYVSQWEDGSLECYTGKYLKEFEISNIMAMN